MSEVSLWEAELVEATGGGAGCDDDPVANNLPKNSLERK